MKKNLLSLIMLCCGISAAAQHSTIDLSGQWCLSLDPDSTGISKGFPTTLSNDIVVLPGTTDTNKKGIKNDKKDETTHLSRHFSYFGKAWYLRTIDVPASWKSKNINLFLERTKPTTVYVDGVEVGKCDDISVPQLHDLTGKLTPGRHILAILVDNGNSVPKQLLGSSHAYTEDTQTNWNGIIGKMYLEAKESPVTIKRLLTHSHAAENSVDVEITLCGNLKKKYSISTMITGKNGYVADQRYVNEGNSEKVVNADGTTTIRHTLQLGSDACKWSEFSPQNLLTLNVRIECEGKSDEKVTTFGLCDFRAENSHFIVNGNKTFLRGKHDACVFPLTGHVAMNYDEWYRYLSICKQYGINHVRFHSWCPPEACFEAADDLGIYLQPELPIWGGFDENDHWLTSFLRDEGRKIIETYGNHPSFVMMGLGNELWGSTELMADYVADFRLHDDIGKGCRRLYTFGSNMYLGYKGVLDGMDYFTTCRIGGEAWGDYNTHVRGSFSFCDAFDGGLINHEYPNTTTNFEKAIEGSRVPIISHETGQFQTYPDYAEMDKYIGVLRPDNMEIFHKRLEKAGMAKQAETFHKASGLWSVELYKADIEMDLRTRNMAGFQLLDIQDYPGQGSAYVGILDAFMNSKGLVRPDRWRHWCSEVVPMAELPRLTYTDGDTIAWRTVVANYDANPDNLSGKSMKWQIIRPDGSVLAEGSNKIDKSESGVVEVAKTSTIACLFNPEISEQVRLTLTVEGTKYNNDYKLWIYPKTDYERRTAELLRNLTISDTIDSKVLSALAKGRKVLLMPRGTMYKEQTVGGLVQTDYWNYRMFKTISENNKKPVSPGTLGLLVNDINHPMFDNFPTAIHSDWQWAAIVKQSRPLIMDTMREDYRPLVQVIDNVERNHRLGLAFEFAVGKGKLFVCMSDLTAVDTYPEVRQLYLSILEYMQGDKFNPHEQISVEELRQLFESTAAADKVEELRNISYD